MYNEQTENKMYNGQTENKMYNEQTENKMYNEQTENKMYNEQTENKMKYKNNNPTSNIKIVKRGKVGTPNTQIHDRSLSWLGICTSIKRAGVKLVLWTQSSPFSEIIVRQMISIYQ